MTTLEQVEKLCAMANISYEEAKAALEAANGDLLDAVIFLEKQGKIKAPTGGGSYSSEKIIDVATVNTEEDYWEKHDRTSSKSNSFMSYLKKAGDFCLNLIHKGNKNVFEVLKGEVVKASFPITVLALLLIFAFWVTIPLVVVGLFFGFRYRVVGPDFYSDTINDAMNSAADAAVNLKESMNKK